MARIHLLKGRGSDLGSSLPWDHASTACGMVGWDKKNWNEIELSGSRLDTRIEYTTHRHEVTCKRCLGKEAP